MKNENGKNNPIDRAKEFAKEIAQIIKNRIEKAKVTRTKDRRPKIPADVPTPPNFSHPRIIKKNGGTVK